MMWGAAACHHQPHRVAFVTERRLQADKNISELKPLNHQIAGKRIYTTRRVAPVFLNFVDIRTKTAIFIDLHSVGNVSCRSEAFSISTNEHFSQLIGAGWQVDRVAFALKALERIPK